MAEVVLDASAVLVLLLGEPGAEEVAGSLPGALLSAVNLAEVVGKLAEAGMPESAVRRALGGLGLTMVPFDPDDAWRAGLLRPETRSAGLSLGDRACIALAQSRGAVAVTADRAWTRLGLGATVRVVGR